MKRASSRGKIPSVRWADLFFWNMSFIYVLSRVSQLLIRTRIMTEYQGSVRSCEHLGSCELSQFMIMEIITVIDYVWNWVTHSHHLPPATVCGLVIIVVSGPCVYIWNKLSPGSPGPSQETQLAETYTARMKRGGDFHWQGELWDSQQARRLNVPSWLWAIFLIKSMLHIRFRDAGHRLLGDQDVTFSTLWRRGGLWLCCQAEATKS